MEYSSSPLPTKSMFFLQVRQDILEYVLGYPSASSAAFLAIDRCLAAASGSFQPLETPIVNLAAMTNPASAIAFGSAFGALPSATGFYLPTLGSAGLADPCGSAGLYSLDHAIASTSTATTLTATTAAPPPLLLNPVLRAPPIKLEEPPTPPAKIRANSGSGSASMEVRFGKS